MRHALAILAAALLLGACATQPGASRDGAAAAPGACPMCGATPPAAAASPAAEPPQAPAAPAAAATQPAPMPPHPAPAAAPADSAAAPGTCPLCGGTPGAGHGAGRGPNAPLGYGSAERRQAEAEAASRRGPPFDAGGTMRLEAGLYECELKRKVIVRRIAADGSSLVLNWEGKDHTLVAVPSRAGAIRYENVSNGLTWITIIGKSMLLDTKVGRQLANECKI